MAKTLYKKTKAGKIQVWKVWVDGDVIHTKFGYLGGAQQHTSKKAAAKNVGKTNERAGWQQAKSEMRSMVKHRLTRGHFNTEDEARNSVVIKPMLAHTATPKVVAQMFKQGEWIVQPKYNGVRCLAHHRADGSVVLLSREGLHYDLPHIMDAVKEMIPPNTMVDGEIYLHGLTFQQISSAVKNNENKNRKMLQLICYDFIDRRTAAKHPYASRRRLLVELFSEFDTPDGRTNRRLFRKSAKQVIDLAPDSLCGSKTALAKLHRWWVKQGYEGVILRNLKGVYEFANRSNFLLKYKAFKDDDYRIVGFKEGRGRSAGAVIYWCETPDGERFKVVPKQSLKERRREFRRLTFNKAYRKETLGSLMKVKYFELTEDGVPWFPVGLGIRLKGD